MSSTISKAVVAALAFGAVHALPQSMAPTPSTAAPSSPTDNSDLIAELITDSTFLQRYQRLLTDGGQELLSSADLVKATVFDFQKDGFPVVGTNGGFATSSNVRSFPILIGSGITVNFGTIGPCGVIIPHVHPRANEYFIVVDGETHFGYMLEIGLLKNQAPNPEISGKLTKYTGTLFPQGSVHYQINDSPDCKPATFFTLFNSEDAGTTTILQTPSGDNTTVVPRQVDGSDFDSVRPLLPPQIVSVVDKCLARCNISV